MGSTRLPGKVWEKLKEKCQLQHLVEPLCLLHGESRLMLVTSDIPKDYIFAEASGRSGIGRGLFSRFPNNTLGMKDVVTVLEK
jgi:spore coat polysaccharide biosynthesis protein SpsF (cytidylyltransferase family)